MVDPRTLRCAVLPLLGLAVGCTPGRAALECGPAAVDAPDDLPSFDLKRVDPERSEVARGFVLLNHFAPKVSFAAALDGCAQHVWWQASGGPDRKITRVRRGLDGRSVLYAEHDRTFETESAAIHRVDPQTGETLSETRALEQHHDFVEHTDGRLAWLAFHYPDNVWMPGLNGRLATDALRVAPEGGGEADSAALFDLIGLTGLEPSWSCSHMREGVWLPGAHEWSHANSLVWQESEQAYYVYVRYWDALLRVHADGTLDWTLGGLHSDFTGTGDLPLHGHLSDAWEDGVLVFDNGDHGDPEVSRVVEVRLDAEARTFEEVWSVPEPEGRHATFLGDARKLPGGNVLVAWSPYGLLQEITPDGDVVWEAETEHVVGRVELALDWPTASVSRR